MKTKMATGLQFARAQLEKTGWKEGIVNQIQ
jgi:hypothetical protein